jgi:hypothetical protein
MFIACVLYVGAFLFLTQSIKFGVIEYVIVGLVLLSIIALIAKVASRLLDKYSVIVDIVNMVIAGVIVVRYGLAFVTDLNHFITLILFIATAAFAVTFVLLAKNLVTAIGKLHSSTSTASPPSDTEGQ